MLLGGGFDLTRLITIISLHSCLKFVALQSCKLFCYGHGEEDYSKTYNVGYNSATGIPTIIFAICFPSTGCHIHFQEFRNEMCDIPISGIFFTEKC